MTVFCSDISNDNELEQVALQYMQGRPNSYVYTKALAELYVDKHRLRLRDANRNRNREVPGPVISSIVRPAIVYNSMAEPAFGWIDSWNGPAAFSMFIFSGLIRRPNFGFTSKWQMIPVDFVANALLSIPIWSRRKTATSPTDDCIPVVNLTLGNHLPGNIYDLLKCGEQYTRLYPSLYIARPIVVPPIRFNTHPIVHRLQIFFSEALYFYFCDLLLMIAGQSSK